MKELTLRQHDIAETILNQFSKLAKCESIKFIQSIFGNTAKMSDIHVTYKSLNIN